MIFNLLMLAAGLFAIYRLPETESNFYKLMALAQVLAIVLLFFEASAVKTTGVMVFAFTAFATGINAIVQKEIPPRKKVIVPLIALPVLIGHIFEMNQWPYTTEIGLVMIIPLVVYIFLVSKHRLFSVEIGVLTVFAADAAIRFAITVLGLANG